METILYKPLFINPQAYYVFPNINGRLEPKTGSGKEPAMFIGNIEVKTIAHGDIGRKQYFYNTNEIDLSAFSNSLVRISLYTNRGNVVLGEWDLDIIEGESENYIDPEILDSLCGVWIMDQNTNESESRNIIKNKIADRGGDLELLNFGYKLNSGYNGYATDFTEWHGTYSNKTQTKITVSIDIYFPISIISFKNVTSAPSFRIKVSGLPKGQNLYYKYINEEGLLEEKFNIPSDGIYTLPATAVSDTPTTVATLANEQYNINIKGLTIEQLPLYEGALVTDGKDDMIVSQKSFIDIVGSVNQPYTIVSMMSFIDNIHFYFNSAVGTETMTISYVSESAIDKTHIFGYSTTNVQNTPNVINNILGDKNDYVTRREPAGSLIGKEFSIQGYLRDGIPTSVSSVAVYWTFIANKVLTTDEINQIIAYFKLDKYVTPQVIYDVKRQGLTNDTPAADWYLKDFSGNGHDMQLYNFAKKLGSGIGKYEADYSTWTKTAGVISTPFGLKITEPTHNYWILYTSNITVPAHKVKISGIPEGGEFRYLGVHILKNGINELPKMEEHPSAIGFTLHKGTTQPSDWVGLSVEQIPDYEGALVSDGIDDYGYADNLPIYKDYTVAIDRAWTNDLVKAQCLASKLNVDNFGSFSFELIENGFSSYSFGISNKGVITIDSNKKISYQSKYVYNGSPIISGNNVDGKDLFLFRNRDSYPYYAEAAIWSYILFPYTLSEFLLERQLKRYKLGTLYPDMVEFRPIVKSNSEYQVIDYYIDNLPAVVGKYYPIDSNLRIAVVTKGVVDEVSSLIINGVSFGTPNVVNNRFTFNGTLSSKSPQKIDITIDEYIRYEDIVQPYPYVVKLRNLDGHIYTWGDKLKVGETVQGSGWTNILDGLYSANAVYYNDEKWGVNEKLVIAKQMIFTANKSWLLDTTEPHAIYSPQKLNIPNSSLKILGYVPDLTGKGNHGRLNNFAYTEDSGVAADGSIKFDGTDDHITIPTLAHGGKCVMMKVNLQSYDKYLYDQRNQWSQYLAIVSSGKTIAYSYSNQGGKTYIDGILNENIIDKDLIGITHNITVANSGKEKSYSPNIGISFAKGNFANMFLYEFMLFPEIPSEDEIKKLNNVMGIEGGYVERPEYYWDAYGKTNSDADRATIIDQVSKDPANALTANNFAYNEENGYVDNGLVSDGVDDNLKNTNMPVLTDYTWIMKRKRLNDKNSTTLCHKGNGSNSNAFLFEYIENGKATRSFGLTTPNIIFPDLISYQTKNSYNGQTINSGTNEDGNVLHIFMGSNVYPYYTKAVFYKAMLYSKTIDTLSINMLKNLFEKDELIDINNPIFKKQ